MNTTHKIEVPIFKAEINFIHQRGWSAVTNELLKRYPDGFNAYEYGKKIKLEY